MLNIENLKCGFGKHEILHGISLTIPKGQITAIVGQSGCGKTTMLNIIGGLDQYTSGDLKINGRSTKKFKDRDWDAYRNNSIGFVFQSYNLIPHQTVLANVELALTLSGVSKSERRKRAIEALEKVGLKEQIHKKPNQMSGGQMQRVAIARALANNPDILLCDEATSALDIENTEEIVELLREINEKTHITIVFITHEMDVAKKLFDRIAFMEDGKLKEVTDIYSAFANPKSDIAKSLVQRVLNVEVPEGLKAKTNEEILRLSYTGDDSYDPVISVASKNYDITMDIINGKVDYIRNKPFGMLIVILRGEDAERKKALEYISKNVYKLERLGGR